LGEGPGGRDEPATPFRAIRRDDMREQIMKGTEKVFRWDILDQSKFYSACVGGGGYGWGAFSSWVNDGGFFP